MSAIAQRHKGSTPAPPYRKGWCPGALQPMETGDGLLARVRARRGRLSLDQAAALADVALRCGNGVIGLSARANLHLRGLTERTLPDLRARLEEAGLIDMDPEVERLRNIVASPLDDVDPEASFDLGPSIAALETRLREDDQLRRLPPKFSFVVDARGRLPLGDVATDVRFDAADDGTFAVTLAGEDALAAKCTPDAVGDVVARLANAFLALAVDGDGKPRRMRALVEREGAEAIFAKAALRAGPRQRSQHRPALREVLGAHAYGAKFVVGAAAAFGEFEAACLEALIARARTLGANSLRLTPWRAFLMTGLDQNSAGLLLDTIAALGFIVDADDARLRIAACPGAPACAHGLRPVRADASDWAPLLPKGEGVVLHVSGCAKGCARPAATAVTVTATASGYDLILAGRAGDPPARRGLTRAGVAGLLTSERASLASAGPT